MEILSTVDNLFQGPIADEAIRAKTWPKCLIIKIILEMLIKRQLLNSKE
jgi:hypothetical protein